MDRRILTGTLAVLMLAGCAGEAGTERVPGTVLEILTRSPVIPPEESINDLNIFVFSGDGFLEDQIYLSSRILEHHGDTVRTRVPVVLGASARIAVCANFGYRISGIATLEELEEYRYHLAYPDEVSRGIPSYGISEDSLGPGTTKVRIKLDRMMTKITVNIDRTGLDKDVRIKAVSVRICNSPRSASVSGPSRARYKDDVFASGYTLGGTEADILNRGSSDGLSWKASLYMLENMQGDLLPEDTGEHEKIPGGNKAEVCSYVEIRAEYTSPAFHTPAGSHICYRFYPGSSSCNFDIERNMVFNYTVELSASGLEAPDWLIDKSSLIPF